MTRTQAFVIQMAIGSVCLWIGMELDSPWPYMAAGWAFALAFAIAED